MTAALTVVGCKKDKKTEGDTTGSTTASGSAMAGSDTMAGSGSATMAGSGSATMAGSGSAMMAGAGSAAAEPPRPATITDEMLAKGDALMDQLIKLGKDLGAAGTDCKKATAAVKAATPGVSASVKDIEKFKPEVDKDPAAKAWLEQHYDARMAKDGDAFMTAGEACRSDKDFVEAMSGLGLFKKKAKEPPPPAGSAAPSSTK